MKSVLRLLLVPLVSLTFAGLSFAQATPATPSTLTAAEKKIEKVEKKAVKSKTRRVTGEVVSADSKAGTLTVKVKDKEMNFTAEAKSAKRALTKVKTGNQVKVSYTEKNGNLMVRSVSKAKAKSESKGMTKGEKKGDTKTDSK